MNVQTAGLIIYALVLFALVPSDAQEGEGYFRSEGYYPGSYPGYPGSGYPGYPYPGRSGYPGYPGYFRHRRHHHHYDPYRPYGMDYAHRHRFGYMPHSHYRRRYY